MAAREIFAGTSFALQFSHFCIPPVLVPVQSLPACEVLLPIIDTWTCLPLAYGIPWGEHGFGGSSSHVSFGILNCKICIQSVSLLSIFKGLWLNLAYTFLELNILTNFLCLT